MKIVCSQSDLKSNLAFVSRAVPPRPEPLVLGNVLLEADETNQKLTMTAFDGRLGIRTSFSADIQEGGTITLPAKLFNDIVSRLPEMEITLTCDELEDNSNLVATLSAASSKLQLNGMDSSEFPELPIVGGENTIDLPITPFLEGLKGCLFAASTELSKEILTGVHVSSSEATALEFAATDSHRLAVVQIFLDEAEDTEASPVKLPEFAVTIPARALRELEKMLGDESGSQATPRASHALGNAPDPLGQATFKMRYDDTQIIFEGSSRTITTLRLTGAYPPYDRLIPSTFERIVICDRKRLLSSLELVSVMAQKNNVAKFSLDSEQGELTLSVDAQDVGSAKQSISAEITGENIDIAFNIKYLADGLKALPSTEVKMQLNEWNLPVIFTPLTGLKMTYLVMPVQIRS